jgi:hypothetical protein
VLVAPTTTSTIKASIRFATFLCEISGSFLTFPEHRALSAAQTAEPSALRAANGFALSP